MATQNMTNSDVMKILKNRIITTEYSPGYILNESDIANEFQLSRTPVREIFKRLESEKYLVLIPRVGAQVSIVDFKFIRECFTLKQSLEGLCASLAASSENENLDDIKILDEIIVRLKGYNGMNDYDKIIQDDELFHKTIRKIANNQLLIDILEQYHGHLERLWYLQTSKVRDVNVFIDTLSEILDAIKKKNSSRADDAAKRHIQAYVNQVKNELFS